MSHASGIPDTRPRTDRHFMLTCTDMQSIEYIKGLKELNFAPGTQYQYINPTFQLLYLFIEKLSGMKFDDYMKANIFEPSKMYTTLYFSEENESKIPNMAHGYILEDGNETASVDSDKPAGAVAASLKRRQTTAPLTASSPSATMEKKLSSPPRPTAESTLPHTSLQTGSRR